MSRITDSRISKVGTAERAFITMPDGVRLAATLYLPARQGPQPCLLEALPYRKDDLTCSYRPDYVRFRDEYGYAVCRLDLRGTGSSEGLAADEYDPQEQRDLHAVIDWLAGRPWCDGTVGMFGTSYSGFNAIQMAAERPPALKAIVAIYATDDRYTDDVHWMGGALRLLDLVDYCHYMTPMNALPPVPAVFGADWRKEWRRRLEGHEPWLLRWLAHPRDDAYWRHGSLRPAYDRIACPTMIVAGWADGYRNNTFRTMAALAVAGVPHRLVAGPWSHAAPSSSRPGPRIDLVPEMARWWDRWLRGADTGVDEEPPVAYFARRSTRPEPDLDTVAGEWRAEDWPSPRIATRSFPLTARPPYDVRAAGAVAAWISCAGHLPYGQPLDQRHDDADALTWEWPTGGLDLAGHLVVRLRLVSSAPVAHLAVRLCDVFPDGTSALITRGTVALPHRAGSAAPAPLTPGEPFDVELELEATSWVLAPENRLRLAVSGSGWPNTAAPPGPLTLEVLGGSLDVPVVTGPSPYPPPVFAPGDTPEEADPGTVWRVERDVLRRETACVVEHGAEYETPYGRAAERYAGRVSVAERTFDQRAEAVAEFTLTWPEATVTVRSELIVAVGPEAYDVTITLDARDGAEQVAAREWRRSFPRDLA